MVKGSNKGAMGRALRMARLGAGLAGSYLGYQIQHLFLDQDGAAKARQAMRQRQGRRIREELGSLRGPVMKLGQALSMQTHSLSPEFTRELATLQMRAPSMHPSLMRAQFRNALGRYPEEIFKSFEEEPMAAASLGQVHRAVTRAGEQVCVKIQYPAIREAIANDFKALRTATFPARLTRHLPEDVLREAEQTMIEETDYRKEAANIEFFTRGLRPLPFMRLPSVFKELSAEKVLTMSFISGHVLDKCLAGRPSREWRDLAGARLVESFFHQALVMGAVHADPHSGNYLFETDATIGLIDFGCVKHLERHVANDFKKLWRRKWINDRAQRQEVASAICGRNVSPDTPGIQRVMRELLAAYEAFYPIAPGAPTIVDFGDPELLKRLDRLAGAAVKNRFMSPDFLFFSRSEIGLYNTLHHLGSRLAMGRIVGELLDRSETV